MLVMCHMTFIIDLAHCGVFVAQSIGARNPKESKGLRFDSSWGLRIFFFVPHSLQDKKTSFFIIMDMSDLMQFLRL